MIQTFEQFKTDWREKEKLPGALNVRCICGQHDMKPLTDDELFELYKIVTNEPEPKVSSLYDLSM